eukprot:g2314.t1
MLLSISVTAPQLLRTTSSAISVKWAPEQSGGAARIKRYDIQWCIDTKDPQDARTMDGWIDVVRYNDDDTGNTSGQPVRERLHFTTDKDWHSVPEEAVNGLKLEASVCGLKPSCYVIKFRVRGRCNAGWGPWSGSSVGLKTLRGDIPPPAFSSVTSNSLEMRWRGLKDNRYGKLKAYVVLGKTVNEEDTWRECYRGMQPKVLVTRIGESGLVAKTMYLFKVMTVASHGPDPSRDDSHLISDVVKIETLGTTPNAPRAPIILSVSHESITVSWTPPCSNGSSITAFQLVGKMGHSSVYSEWYTGPNTKFTVGAARSNAMNFSTTRILALTEYNLKVAASNAYGMSPYSTPVMAVTEPPPDLHLPDAPAVPKDSADASADANGVEDEVSAEAPFVLHSPTNVHDSSSDRDSVVFTSFSQLRSEAIDPSVLFRVPKSLKWLLDNDVGEDSDFDFTVTKEGFGTSEIVELIPDGKNISVTDLNKDLYVSLQVQWRVNGSILDQINAVRSGFAELIPNSHISVFTPEEFMLLLNGKSEIDIDEMLASHTCFNQLVLPPYTNIAVLAKPPDIQLTTEQLQAETLAPVEIVPSPSQE